MIRILYLGPPSPLIDRLRADAMVVRTENQIRPEDYGWADWLISYGYRHILRAPALDLFPGRAINLHIALLPWNRGADPNLWSWIDDTPKGVTIHHIDAGIDTGDIIAQQKIRFDRDPTMTLARSYAILKESVEDLFMGWWPSIRAGDAPRKPQPLGGSFHKRADRAKVERLLTKGWDTRVSDLCGAGGSLSGGSGA